MTLTESRYQRNHNAIDAAQQLKLGRSHVVVIGFGGLGERVAELLCRLGVGCLTIVDSDAFEPSNLNRQLFCTEENIGKSKVQTGIEELEKINSSVEITAIEEIVSDSNVDRIIDGCDCIADCLDNRSTRLCLSRAAKQHGIPMVHAAIAGWCGRVVVASPDSEVMEMLCYSGSGSGGGSDSGSDSGNGNSGESESKSSSESGSNSGSEKMSEADHGVEIETGSLGFTASVAASIQAGEITKVLLGIHEDSNNDNSILEFNLKNNMFEQIPLG